MVVGQGAETLEQITIWFNQDILYEDLKELCERFILAAYVNGREVMRRPLQNCFVNPACFQLFIGYSVKQGDHVIAELIDGSGLPQWKTKGRLDLFAELSILGHFRGEILRWFGSGFDTWRAESLYRPESADSRISRAREFETGRQ